MLSLEGLRAGRVRRGRNRVAINRCRSPLELTLVARTDLHFKEMGAVWQSWSSERIESKSWVCATAMVTANCTSRDMEPECCSRWRSLAFAPGRLFASVVELAVTR